MSARPAPGPAAWPAPERPRDPFASPRAAPDPQRALLLDAIDAALHGRGPVSEAEALARRLGLGSPLLVDAQPRPAAPAGALPSDDDLVRIAADFDPAVIESAADAILGPYAADADRASRIAAAAWGALMPGDATDAVPLERFAARAGGELRAAARAVLRAPPCVWRLEQARADAIRIAPPLGGLGAAAAEGWVRLRAPIAAPAGQPAPGGAVIARAVPTDAGWVAVAPIAAPAVPAQLERWLWLGALAARAVGRPVRTTADAWLHAGHDIARRTLEAAYARSLREDLR